MMIPNGYDGVRTRRSNIVHLITIAEQRVAVCGITHVYIPKDGLHASDRPCRECFAVVERGERDGL